MNLDDCEWAIDTLRREEDILRELKRQAQDRDDKEAAAMFRLLVGEIFGVRQLLETERRVLRQLKGRIP